VTVTAAPTVAVAATPTVTVAAAVAATPTVSAAVTTTATVSAAMTTASAAASKGRLVKAQSDDKGGDGDCCNLLQVSLEHDWFLSLRC